MNTTFSNSLYDKLKFIALILLPAIATLYATVAGIWSLPEPEKVVGTIVAVDTLLGALLHLSTQQYHATTAAAPEVNASPAGDIVVTQTPQGKKQYSLELTGDPDQIVDTQSHVVFKVVKR